MKIVLPLSQAQRTPWGIEPSFPTSRMTRGEVGRVAEAIPGANVIFKRAPKAGHEGNHVQAEILLET